MVKAIHGPFSVVIAYLRYLGWKPFALNVWKDENDVAWQIDNMEMSPEGIISKLIERSNTIDLNRAALHYGGSGVEHGIDHINTFAWHRSKDISYIDKCTVETILCGGCYPNARVNQAFPEVDPICSRCKVGKDASLFLVLPRKWQDRR